MPNDMPLFIVLNAGSGRNDPNDSRWKIDRILGDARRPHQFHLVHRASDIDAQARAAVNAARQRGGAVIAVGGDGTISGVVQHVLPTGLPFGVIPGGTFNYFGRTHGIPTDTEAATRALLHAEVEPVQVGLVNERAFLVNASIGLYPQVQEDRELYKHRFGRFRLVALYAGLMTLLRDYTQLDLRIEHDAKIHALHTPTLFIGNNALQLQQIGIPEASAQPHGFLVAVTPQPVGKWQMLGLIVRGLAGQLGRSPAVGSFAFKTLTAVRLRSAARSLKVATDGEILWLKPPLTFRVSPQPLQLLMPRDVDKVFEKTDAP